MAEEVGSASDWKDCFAVLQTIPAFSAHQFEWVAATGSTNDDLRREWQQADPRARFRVAGHQSKGRGQFDRCWYDLPGHSLLFSFSWSESFSKPYVKHLSLLAGLALWQAVTTLTERKCPRSFYVKWPNDLWNDQGKIAGVLSETSVGSERLDAVIGVGLNVSRIPEETGFPVSCLQHGEMRLLTPQQILIEFCRAWNTCINLDVSELIAAFRKSISGMVGRRYEFSLPDGSSVVGTACDIDDSGCLLVKDEMGGWLTIQSLASNPVEQETGPP